MFYELRVHSPLPYLPNGPFLSPQDLLRAIDGDFDGDIPLAGWAGALGTLYREWCAEPSMVQIGQSIDTVVHEIDVWIGALLPRPRPGAPRWTDSVGGVIGRVAEAAVRAQWALHCASDAIQRHRAWDHLAEMRGAYEDLAQLALSGSIDLPKSWPAVSWPAAAR
ncbi:hypothetical protein [Nocardia sp. NPDC056000]|uniref:hypothetical protein n=1 Tax=Nocardia sp. NPDC056000 TaxID=3345674 RepID=UPI0035DDB8CB